MIYHSSDFHLGHKSIIEYDKRPYKSVDEMDNAIIDTLNDIVTEKDLLVFGGDFALPRLHDRDDMDAYLTAIRAYHARLRCKNIIFVGGNHDRLYHRRRGELIPNWRFWDIFRSQDICENCDALLPRDVAKCYVCGCKHTLPYECVHPMGYEMKISRKMCADHKIPDEFDGLNVVCTHYSHRVWNKSHVPGKSINLYGHSHGGLPGMMNAFDVGWNIWYRPLSLVEILTDLMPKHNATDLGKITFCHHPDSNDGKKKDR
jgi:calcineurin-like phosphoesterase family protein